MAVIQTLEFDVTTDAVTPDVTIERHSDGSYVFTDLQGNKVVIHSNHYDFKRFIDLIEAGLA
jgi:hypothetical protein